MKTDGSFAALITTGSSVHINVCARPKVGQAPLAGEGLGLRDGRGAAAAAGGGAAEQPVTRSTVQYSTGYSTVQYRIVRTSSDPHHRQLETCIFILCR